MSYVVTLTGGKNNSGDFLIKYKAHALLNKIRPDLKVIDLNGWEVSEKDLEVINGATVLLLTGGPALIPNMVPAIYSVGDILDKIKVPIATFGIGWFHANGDWKDTTSFVLNKQTRELFSRLSSNGILNSVRDHFTYEIMANNGVKNVVMTGCPVLYNGGKLANTEISANRDEFKVALSLGVGFKDMASLYSQTKGLLLQAKDNFADITAIFHHSLSVHEFVASSLTRKQQDLVDFLEKNNIKYVDASGSAEALMQTYDNYDLHFGYRVHAHLYMLSQGKPSYLIAEDGRGTGQQQVLGEPNFRSYTYSANSKALRGIHRLGVKLPTKLIDKDFVPKFVRYIKADIDADLVKHDCSIFHIRKHFKTMQTFIERLPS
jgi:hypothetical protein